MRKSLLIATLLSATLSVHAGTAHPNGYKMAIAHCEKPFKYPYHKKYCLQAHKYAIYYKDDKLLKITGTLKEINDAKVLNYPKTDLEMLMDHMERVQRDSSDRIIDALESKDDDKGQ